MKKLLLIFFFTFNAFAGEMCKSKMQTYFFKDIYIITLCKQKDVKYEEIFSSQFSIELQYQIDVSKDFLTNSSIKEIERNYKLTSEEEEFYRNQLYSIFPAVAEYDKIKLYYDFKTGIKFYHNGSFIGEIKEPIFAKRVSDIWINPNTKFKDTRNYLFLEMQ